MISGTDSMAFSSPSTPLASFYNAETLAEKLPREVPRSVLHEQHCLCFRNRCLLARSAAGTASGLSSGKTVGVSTSRIQGMLGMFTSYFHVIRQDKFGILTELSFPLQEVYAKATAFSFLTGRHVCWHGAFPPVLSQAKVRCQNCSD